VYSQSVEATKQSLGDLGQESHRGGWAMKLQSTPRFRESVHDSIVCA
jgi:hypothetical protein